MQSDHGLSVRRCDASLIGAIEGYIKKDNPGRGFGLLFGQALQPRGFGKTWAWRVYVGLKLNFPRRGKRRLPERIREPLEVPVNDNDTWSADFMADALWSGRRFRTSTSFTT